MVRDRYSTYMVCVWCMVVCVREGCCNTWHTCGFDGCGCGQKLIFEINFL